MPASSLDNDGLQIKVNVPRLVLSSAVLGSSLGNNKRGNLDHFSSRRNRPSLIAQTSGDKVCLLLNGQHLIQILDFWSNCADKGKAECTSPVECLCVYYENDSNAVFVCAASEDQIVIWSTTSLISGNERWQVHSTIQMGRSKLITCLDLRKDALLVGAQSCLSLWRFTNDPTHPWKRHWKLNTPRPVKQCNFCSSDAAFAMLLERDRRLTIWTYSDDTTRSTSISKTRVALSGRIAHSRVIRDWSWREQLEESSSTSSITTCTVDGVIRLWAPVIDEPSSMRNWFTLDSDTTLIDSKGSFDCVESHYHYLEAKSMHQLMESSLRWLQRDLQVIDLAVSEEAIDEREVELKRSRAKRLEHLINETPDMFATIDNQGNLIIRALANFERRPPTLCQSFTVLKMNASQIIPNPDEISSLLAHAQAVDPSLSCYNTTGTLIVRLRNGDVTKFEVNPALLFDGMGQGLTSIDYQTNTGFLHKDELRRVHSNRIRTILGTPHGNVICSISTKGGILGWKLIQSSDADRVANLLRPIRLDRIPHDCDVMSAGNNVFVWYEKDPNKCFLAYNDGVESYRHCLQGQSELTFLNTKEQANQVIVLGGAAKTSRVYVWRIQRNELGNSAKTHEAQILDLVVTSPIQAYFSIPNSDRSDSIEIGCKDALGIISIWTILATGAGGKASVSSEFAIGPQRIGNIQCSLDKTMALAVDSSSISIYNLNQAFLSNNAEVKFSLKDKITSFAWSYTSNIFPLLLAVSTKSSINIYSRRRLSYRDFLGLGSASGWILLCQVDVSSVTSDPISDISWLSDGSLVVAVSSHLFRYNGVTMDSIDSIKRSSHLINLALDQTQELVDYHPETLLQCLLWNKLGVACQILINLANAIDHLIPLQPLQFNKIHWEEVELIEQDWHLANQSSETSVNDNAAPGVGNEDQVARLEKLLTTLDTDKISSFDDERIEQSDIGRVLKSVLLIHRHYSSLDTDSLRYIAALGCTQGEGICNLDYQSFLWAFYSQKQESLLSIIETTYFNDKMDWSRARQCGVFIWLHSQENLCILAEKVARQQFNSLEERNPISCSLLYYALGKHKLVASLWKQAYWHPDQRKMITFLNNDFNQSRWKSAALKNAFALLSQRKFEMAASFFLLGGQLRDAVNVCVRNLNDVSLGIAIARLYEGGINGPVFCDLIESTILPEAVRSKNRWQASLALLILGKRELALLCLCQPMQLSTLTGLQDNMQSERENEASQANEEAIVACHFSRQLQDTFLPESMITKNIESRLLLMANEILTKNGLASLGLAILKTHQLQTNRRQSQPVKSRKAIDESKLLPIQESISAIGIKMIPEKKQKVASLIQAAKPESSKQAEMTFDVNSFNF